MKLINIVKTLVGVFCLSIAVGTILPAQASAYTYTSKEYGYSIECPQKPLGAIPLIDANQKGEILVFKNEGYTILKGWIVATNAFDKKDIPDFDKMTKADSEKYAANLIANRGYETVLFIPVNGHKVMYAVWPKEVYVDSNKDGKNDKKPQQNTSQRIDTYIQGQKNNYVVTFFASEAVDKQDMTDYQKGLMSFKEVSVDVKATDNKTEASKKTTKKK